MSKNKKKLGYSQYEDLLADAHRKIDFLADKYQELQTYFIGYVEFHEENVEFHDWIEKRIKEAKAQAEKDSAKEFVMEEEDVLKN
jgi:hypothetical protein|tara:strand:- start:2260 stop:2514 length:255 start_codon:yes stop_codon:yes gene_type:complete